MNGATTGARIHVLSNNSGYYVYWSDGSSRPNIWKVTIGNSNAQWLVIPSTSSYSYGQLMLSDTKLFVLGASGSPPYYLHFYKISFGGSTIDWATKMACISGTWLNDIKQLLK